MKNKLLLSTTVIILSLSPIVSFLPAQAGAQTQTIEQGIQAEKDSIKNSVDSRRQDALNQIIDRVKQFTDNIITRYEAAVNRLDILAGRIDSRITKIQAKKIDVTQAKALLATAKTDIDTARTSVEDIASTTSNMPFGTTTPLVKENFGTIKTQMDKAKEDILVAQSALQDVIDNLKSASTTETNN